MLLMIKITICVWLSVGAVFDYIYKNIPKWYAYMTLILGTLIGMLYMNGITWEQILGGCMGALFFLLAKITKEQIGYGDAFILTGLGLMIGISEIIWTIMNSFFLLFIVAFILMFMKKANRKTKIAFLPFLLIGYGITILMGGNIL